MNYFTQSWQWTLDNECGTPADPAVTPDPTAADPHAVSRFGFNSASYPNDPIFTLPAPAALMRADELALAMWCRLSLVRLADPIVAAKVFDLCFNTGDRTGIEILQRALNAMGSTVAVDGILGPITANAANSYTFDHIMPAILRAAQTHYVQVVHACPAEVKNFNGWMRRLYRHAGPGGSNLTP